MLKRLGYLDEAIIFSRPKIGDESKRELEKNGVFFLLGKDLQNDLRSLLNNFSHKEKEFMRQFISYAAITQKLVDLAIKFQNINIKRRTTKLEQSGTDLSLLRLYVSFCYRDGIEIIPESLLDLCDEAIKVDSFADFLKSTPSAHTPLLRNFPQYRFKNRYIQKLTIPAWNGTGLNAEVVGYRDVFLDMKRARWFSGNQVKIAICGPAKSGKSTSCVSLVSETDDLLYSLKSLPYFSGTNITVTGFDLDLGSPTLKNIMDGKGKDKVHHQNSKRPWDINNVYPVLKELKNQRENIIFLDMPGKITNITSLLLTAPDVSIILGVNKNWDETKAWRKFVESHGINHQAEAGSYSEPSKKAPESLPRLFERERCTGRIVNIKREGRNWDNYLQFLAKALLFRFIPDYLENIHKKHQAIIEALWEEN